MSVLESPRVVREMDDYHVYAANGRYFVTRTAGIGWSIHEGPNADGQVVASAFETAEQAVDHCLR